MFIVDMKVIFRQVQIRHHEPVFLPVWNFLSVGSKFNLIFLSVYMHMHSHSWYVYFLYKYYLYFIISSTVIFIFSTKNLMEVVNRFHNDVSSYQYLISYIFPCIISMLNMLWVQTKPILSLIVLMVNLLL